ncbi:hypothetical protein K2P97_07775 [bacterium]|nr:hypothetical protein [bacterium]
MFNVESIIELFNVILKIAFFGGIVLLITKFVKFKRSNSVKSDVLNLQAKLSQLRLALKGKIKKKSNIFRGSFKTAITEGDMIDNALKQLVDNPFESSEDFQGYFDLSRRIVNFIQVENSGDAVANVSVENNFMCSDFKTEMDIVRIIKEMTDISSKINTRIEENNRVSPSNPIAKVDSLIFTSMVDINRIFKEDTHTSSFKPSTPSGDGGSDQKAS